MKIRTMWTIRTIGSDENVSNSTHADGAGPLTGRQDLLNQSVREIQNALSGNGKLKINRKIRLKVRSLTAGLRP